MSPVLIDLALFAAKTIIIFLFIFGVLILFFTLAVKNKDKTKGKLVIKNLNKKYAHMAEGLLAETLPSKLFKLFKKEQNAVEKAKLKSKFPPKNIFVLNFQGDMKASAVAGLSEEITTILNVANPQDEVILCLESAGGFVHGYGLAAAQLMRLRTRQIPLTITIDKIAASGGYLMACIGNKVISAPFAIIGSIGVLVQIPNFNRLLKDNHVDFVQLTAGEYKRTVTMFGENTEAGREKLKQEIEEIHQLFKRLIKENRPHIDIQKVATGEHWLGQQAIDLNLVDEIKTSDDYLLERSKTANLYEIRYEIKKPFLTKLTATASLMREKLFGVGFHPL
jgi:serine protease SohB